MKQTPEAEMLGIVIVAIAVGIFWFIAGFTLGWWLG